MNQNEEDVRDIIDKYNALRWRYDNYDNLCYDCGILGFVLGVVITIVIYFVLTLL